MAREWALAGVSEEELQPPPPIQQPQTPQGKWENFWYHHKWKVVVAVFIVLVLAVIVHQMVTRDDPDYFVVLVTDEPQHPNLITAFEMELMPFGEDLDGDGKVEVMVENLYVNPDDLSLKQMVDSNRQTLAVHLVSADRMIYLFEQNTYEAYMRPVLEGSEAGLFADVGLPSDSLVENGECWDWYGSKLQQSELFSELIKELSKQNQRCEPLPEHIYFGVRGASGTAEGKEADVEVAAAFLRRLIEAQKTENAQ
ncbi:MAG: hypothetical protein IJF42_05500 [Clostridia bacterium]|nr:hypothetical protein [Clostridia bacterium]